MDALHTSIPNAAHALGIGRSATYLLLDAGKLKSVKIGSRRLVTVASVKAFADSLAMKGA